MRNVPTDELPCGTWNGVLLGAASFLVGGIVTATALIIWAYKG